MVEGRRSCFDDGVRALFSTTAGAGHFGPMVPFARACAAAGHEVAVAAPASFASHVEDAGLRHLPFPDVAPERLGAVFGGLSGLPREDANRIVISEVFGRLDAQAALPTLTDLCASWRPDVVVRDPCEFGSLVAARKAGIPDVQVAISLDQFLVKAAGWLDEPLAELQALAGLSPARAADLLAPPTFTSVPAMLEVPLVSDEPAPDGVRADGAGADRAGADRAGRTWRFRHESMLAAALPGTWGDAAAPLVYVSFGSVAGSFESFTALYRGMVEVMADLPVRVLMTTGSRLEPRALGPLPANAYVVHWWPQQAVMPHAALVVGHGGFGTTMATVSAGVPQIVMPLLASDQFLNAERIHQVGAGVRLLGGLDAVEQVPAAVGQVLGEPGFAEVARMIAAEMAALPGVSTSVDTLCSLAG